LLTVIVSSNYCGKFSSTLSLTFLYLLYLLLTDITSEQVLTNYLVLPTRPSKI
jgi:hypothetical protein